MNIKYILILLLLATTTHQIKSTVQESKKFTLITTLYNETNAERIQEYMYCLEQNLAHPLIDTIHVIYDTTKDNVDNKIFNYLQNKKITISLVDKRPSYGFCFNVANRLYPNRKIILSNADIYFNETLTLLTGYNLTNKFLAITRWDITKDGRLEQNFWHGEPVTCSQDVWIFNAPIKRFTKDHFQIGTQHCDGQIAYQAQKAHLKVINPCLSIQCCHLHLSEIRNYPIIACPANMIVVPWSKLEKNS